jgi:hypothetical protein
MRCEIKFREGFVRGKQTNEPPLPMPMDLSVRETTSASSFSLSDDEAFTLPSARHLIVNGLPSFRAMPSFSDTLNFTKGSGKLLLRAALRPITMH